MTRRLCLLCSLLLLLSGISSWTLAQPPQIYVIPKGSQHLFWKTVRAGAEQAGKDLGVSIYFRGPGEDDNRFGQEVLIRRAIDQAYDAIVLAPNHDNKYVALIKEARAKGVVVVIIDSQMQGDAHQHFVATDNYRAGVVAGQTLRLALKDEGRVMLLRYLKDNTSTEMREQGFIDAMQSSSIEIVHEGYVGASVGEAARNSLALLDQAGPVDGIFAPNESSTEGVLIALKSTKQLGSVKVVGFDYSPDLLDSLKRGELEALIFQQPYRIGYGGVQAAVAAINQEPLQRQIWIDAVVVDNRNYLSAEVQEIIQRSAAQSP